MEGKHTPVRKTEIQSFGSRIPRGLRLNGVRVRPLGGLVIERDRTGRTRVTPGVGDARFAAIYTGQPV